MEFKIKTNGRYKKFDTKNMEVIGNSDCKKMVYYEGTPYNLILFNKKTNDYILIYGMYGYSNGQKGFEYAQYITQTQAESFKAGWEN